MNALRSRAALLRDRVDVALRPRPRPTDAPATFEQLRSQPCTQAQMLSPAYQLWADRLGDDAKLQRRQWEVFYVLEALRQQGMIRSGSTGHFAGTPGGNALAYLVDAGCDIGTGEPHELDAGHGFDFVCSVGTLDELGGVDARLRLVHRSLRALRDGGVAVHTLSLAVSSRIGRLGHTAAVCTKPALVRLEQQLRAAGHGIDCTFALGGLPADRWIDRPPYSPTHLVTRMGSTAVTSFGLLVRKGTIAS